MLDCGHSNPEIQKRLESIYRLNPKKMDFRLDEGPYIDLLAKLGNPHLKLPPIIHVAGTNGKGSTIAFLKSMLEREGKKIHAYNSPHLIKFNERITVNGHHISDENLTRYLDMIEAANDGRALTFFEYTTAMAFKIFSDYPADFLLLETGLGGRLDCTNIVKNPVATVVTSIGYDHLEWLGNTIDDIAVEKAGIMKENVPCFVAPQIHNVNYVFENRAKDVGCEVHFVTRAKDLPELGLLGDHQKDNASVALSVVTALGLVSGHRDDAKMAMARTFWPARMEKISEKPQIWFDCGHNADGARAIAKQLATWKLENPNRAIQIILALAKDKNPNDFLAPMIPHIDGIICVDLPNARNPQMAKGLKDRITLLLEDIDVGVAHTIAQAIEMLNPSEELILITGSLYLYEQLKS